MSGSPEALKDSSSHAANAGDHSSFQSDPDSSCSFSFVPSIIGSTNFRVETAEAFTARLFRRLLRPRKCRVIDADSQ